MLAEHESQEAIIEQVIWYRDSDEMLAEENMYVKN